MGSSQSLKNLPNFNKQEKISNFQINIPPPLSVLKTRLPPLSQTPSFARSTMKSTDENQIQNLFQSHSSSGSSVKDTPQKSNGKLNNDNGVQVFNWQNDTPSTGHEALPGNIKAFSYDTSREHLRLSADPIKSKFQIHEQNSVTMEKKKYSLDQKKMKEHLSIFKLNYQNIEKKKVLIKLAFVGARTAVGKSTLIKSFIEQSIDFHSFEIKQTIGCDISFFIYELDDTQINLQLWEFESNEQSLANWKHQINRTFDAIIFVFDEFGQECAQKIKNRLLLIQQICNSPDHIIPIMMAGNDRLNMTITGKEVEIMNALKKMDNGERIQVKIIDPKQLKETNNLFKTIIKDILDLQNNLT